MRKSVFLLLCLLFSLFAHAEQQAESQEKTYTVTAEQLARLERVLEKYEADRTTARNLLQELTRESERHQKSLEAERKSTANLEESLAKYAKETAVLTAEKQSLEIDIERQKYKSKRRAYVIAGLSVLSSMLFACLLVCLKVAGVFRL